MESCPELGLALRLKPNWSLILYHSRKQENYRLKNDSVAKPHQCGSFSKNHWRDVYHVSCVINLPILICSEESSHNKSEGKWGKGFKAEHSYCRTHQRLVLQMSYHMQLMCKSRDARFCTYYKNFKWNRSIVRLPGCEIHHSPRYRTASSTEPRGKSPSNITGKHQYLLSFEGWERVCIV